MIVSLAEVVVVVVGDDGDDDEDEEQVLYKDPQIKGSEEGFKDERVIPFYL